MLYHTRKNVFITSFQKRRKEKKGEERRTKQKKGEERRTKENKGEERRTKENKGMPDRGNVKNGKRGACQQKAATVLSDRTAATCCICSSVSSSEFNIVGYGAPHDGKVPRVGCTL